MSWFRIRHSLHSLRRMKTLILLVALTFLFFSAYALFFPSASGRLLRLHRRRMLQVRLASFFGVIYMGLFVLTSPRLKLLELSSSASIPLVKLDLLLLGVWIGMYLAFLTERFDER